MFLSVCGLLSIGKRLSVFGRLKFEGRQVFPSKYLGYLQVFEKLSEKLSGKRHER